METEKVLHKTVNSIIPKRRLPYSPVNERLKTEVQGIIRVVADKRSIPALISLLDDENFDIRWIAAESLIKIGRSSIIPLLTTIRDGNQLRFPGKAQHVLQCLLTRHEKKEFQELLSCLSTTGCIEKSISEASILLRKVYGVN
jgi:hypothetical protein